MEPQLGFSIGSSVCPGLSKLIEECGEVMQIAGKLIATGGNSEHWDGTNLKLRMEEELADLLAAISFFGLKNKLNLKAVLARSDAKVALFQKWHEQQGKQDGTPKLPSEL